MNGMHPGADPGDLSVGACANESRLAKFAGVTSYITHTAQVGAINTRTAFHSQSVPVQHTGENRMSTQATTTTKPATTPANGEKPKQTRNRKALNARTAAVKIAEMIEKLPADQRDKAVNLAKALLETA